MGQKNNSVENWEFILDDSNTGGPCEFTEEEKKEMESIGEEVAKKYLT